MAIWGGAMGGYWETGSALIARRPASMTIMAFTHAQIGRFIKNLDMSSPLLLCFRGIHWACRGAVSLTRECNGLYGHSRTHLLNSFEDDPVACLKSVADQPAVADCTDDLYDARLCLFSACYYRNRCVSGRVAAHPPLRDQDSLLTYPFFQDSPDKHTRQQRLFRVREDRPQSNGAGALVHCN